MLLNDHGHRLTPRYHPDIVEDLSYMDRWLEDHSQHGPVATTTYELLKIFNKYVPNDYWLHGGTLIGALREKEIMEHDPAG